MDLDAFKKAELAIRASISHVVKHGSDDIFKPPVFSSSIEHEVIVGNQVDFEAKAFSDTLDFIKRANLQLSRIGPLVNSLIIKDERSFRQVSWIDPFDAIKYLALCRLLFDKIEDARIPKELGYIHSHRKSDDPAEIFDPKYGYDSFRTRSGEMSREREGQWKVVTDISNFFDRIGNHSLENHLLDIGCEKTHVTLLREMLLFWAGDRRSFGVPVGSDASRIISEAVLIDIDRKLRDLNVPFVRYVDDFRLFAETRAEAYSLVQLLTSMLADEGLSLNSKKTEIMQILDADDPKLDPNRFGRDEHQVINLDEKQLVQRQVRVSGRTQVSRYYREPGKDALRNIQKINKTDLIKKFSDTPSLMIEDQIKLIVKYFVYVEQDIELLRVVIERRITSIFYLCDALIKERERLSAETRSKVLNFLKEAVSWDKAPYPYQVPVLRLTSTEGFLDPTLASSLVDRHKLTDNYLFLRELVSLCYSVIDRPRIRALALETYSVSPNFLKRAIYCAVVRHPKLADDEKRPLLKNMIQHSDDWFLNRISKA